VSVMQHYYCWCCRWTTSRGWPWQQWILWSCACVAGCDSSDGTATKQIL